jgi:hypothetical protein
MTKLSTTTLYAPTASYAIFTLLPTKFAAHYFKAETISVLVSYDMNNTSLLRSITTTFHVPSSCSYHCKTESYTYIL